jgi:hypothetical protein
MMYMSSSSKSAVGYEDRGRSSLSVSTTYDDDIQEKINATEKMSKVRASGNRKEKCIRPPIFHRCKQLLRSCEGWMWRLFRSEFRWTPQLSSS